MADDRARRAVGSEPQASGVVPRRSLNLALVLVLGCGYTAGRVARRLLAHGERVVAVARDLDGMAAVALQGGKIVATDVSEVRSRRALARQVPGADELRVLHSIPPLGSDARGPDALGETLRALGRRVSRLVYLSSTRVYGRAQVVDAGTPAIPEDDAGRRRLEGERRATEGPWPTLVLRPAAIYGPHRGLHVALQRGQLGRVRDPDRVVSRVYVDDLAALAEAALFSEAVGEMPVADDLPATAREIATFCEELGLPGLPAAAACSASPGEERGRRVDGVAIRKLLSQPSICPSYRVGIPMALAEEKGASRGPGGCANGAPAGPSDAGAQ